MTRPSEGHAPSWPIRKTPAHFPLRRALHHTSIIYLTVCTEKRKPILCRPECHELLLTSWEKADQWKIGRYVILPDHVHLFCSPACFDSTSLDNWVKYWKTIVSRSWPNRNEQPIWQKSYWDTELRRGQSYDQKWRYVRQNPTRKGLAATEEEWLYQGELNVLNWIG
jgi:REP element-mobilizing transposase RayT